MTHRYKCESQLVGTSLIILVVTQMNKERLDTGFCHRLIHSHTRVSSSDYVPTGMYSTENRHCVWFHLSRNVLSGSFRKAKVVHMISHAIRSPS